MTSRGPAPEQEVLQSLLKSLRQKAGMRQVDVAVALRIPQSMVSKYEVGERRLDILELRVICKLFGIDLSDFVSQLEARLEATRETD